MEKFYNLTDLAKELRVKIFLVQLWEKEFGFKPSVQDGHKFYDAQDLDNFMKIKDLIFNKKFSLQTAKMQFKLPAKQIYEKFEANEVVNENIKEVLVEQVALSVEQDISPAVKVTNSSDLKVPDQFFVKLLDLKEKLVKFKENLG